MNFGSCTKCLILVLKFLVKNYLKNNAKCQKNSALKMGPCLHPMSQACQTTLVGHATPRMEEWFWMPALLHESDESFLKQKVLAIFTPKSYMFMSYS